MNNKKLFKFAFANSLGVAAYIFFVTLIIQNGQKIFDNMNSIIGFAAFLMLFVLSAAVVGSLVLAMPVMLYIDGAKKEAVKLLVYTIGFLFVITLIILIILAIIK